MKTSPILSRRSALFSGGALMALTAFPSMRAFAQDMMLDGEKIMAPAGEFIVHPISHASLALGIDGKTIYADPVGEAAMYADLPKPDLILVTHEHGDHYNVDTLNALLGDNTMLITNPAVYDKLPADLQAKATKMANGDEGDALGLPISAVPAYNISEDRKQYHPQGRDNGYILSALGGKVYIAGDTENTPEMKALTDITLAFLPMNLPFTMTEEQAADAVAAFKPKVVYPYHYRDSDPEKFKSLVDAGGSGAEVKLYDWYS